MSGFTFKNREVLYPVGSIIQYCETSDPDGWLICDGVNRTSTDELYYRLAILLNTMQGITTNTSNSITPPDLRSKFLFGSSNTTSNIGSFGGNNTKKLGIDNLPPHTHTGTTGNQSADHGHAYNKSSYAVTKQDNGNNPNRYDNEGDIYTTGENSTNHTHNFTSSSTGSNTNSIAAFSILPPHFIINYIMKY